jgi:acylphosphatase
VSKKRGPIPKRRRVGGSGYRAWVAGHATTASISASTVQNNDGTVSVSITAAQADGSVKTYAGTYTVANGAIVAANITQTGGSS